MKTKLLYKMKNKRQTKKAFEQPQAFVIELNTYQSILTGSFVGSSDIVNYDPEDDSDNWN